MPAKKLYDMAIKIGEYQNAHGETKGRWINIGSAMQGEDGNKFLLLDRHFNPAGVPNPDDRGNVLVSLFPPKDQQGNQQQGGQQQSAPSQNTAPEVDDEIPFSCAAA